VEKRDVRELVKVAEEEVAKLENDKNKAIKYV
jgi:DNA-binding Xre family transcriptional regulator